MSWRVVTITNRCKLEHRLNFLVCRGEETIKIHMSEISTLIVENTAVAITASLMCELVRRKIKVIFCDEKHNPFFELIPSSLRYDTSGCLRRQIAWKEENKQIIWTEIVRQKIYQQMSVLQDGGYVEQSKMLFNYMTELQFADITNREGHAAKVYFNALFGNDFTRQVETDVNSALDYGYSILLSAFNREVSANGYTANIGINHNNEFNHFNLSCDLMEPFRPLVDRAVLTMDCTTFTKEHKHLLQQVLNREITFDGKRYSVNNAIGLYVKRTLAAIETGDVNMMCFYSL
ncbi:MAG: type II CRISPR-associated endonuclease Cas1 [Corallococcus sp.]|nr:type II CRISPR-associated endonuclease Cas1 [Corallococcus sp.]